MPETSSSTEVAPRGKPWTSTEIQRLRQLAGMDPALIAEELDRSLTSVKMMAHRARISLRRPHLKGGLILGQPRGVSWKANRETATHVQALSNLRADVIAGKVDPAELERAVRRSWLVARGAPICPSCARNPQEVARTGLCTDCHLKELARAHRDGTYDTLVEAKREHAREKQRSKRRRARQEAE